MYIICKNQIYIIHYLHANYFREVYPTSLLSLILNIFNSYLRTTKLWPVLIVKTYMIQLFETRLHFQLIDLLCAIWNGLYHSVPTASLKSRYNKWIPVPSCINHIHLSLSILRFKYYSCQFNSHLILISNFQCLSSHFLPSIIC